MATIGTHAVNVTPSGGAAVDVSCWVLDVNIQAGRDDPQSQPDAATATVAVLSRPELGDLPGALEVGSALVVTTTTAAASVRFTGTITDIALGWEDGPEQGVGQVVAAGILSQLGTRLVGDTPYPQELDGARVSRIMAAAGITLDPLYSDPGTVQLLPRDIDTAPALDTSQAAAQSASGVVWATRGGVVRYADADHRKSTAVELTLDDCNILITPTWRRTTEGLVNAVSVGYGVAPEGGGDQPRYLANRADSIARYGTRAFSITTQLATADDATALGEMLLVRNSSPVWVMADLPIDVGSLTATEYDQLLGLEMHSLVNVTMLPSVGGTPSTALLWVEGWAEHLANGVHEITLVVSGYCRTVPAPTWNTVDPAWVWGGQTWTERRRNTHRNPKAAADTSGYGAAPGAGGVMTGPTRMTDGALVIGGQTITTYTRVTVTTAPTAHASTGMTASLPSSDVLTVTAGQPFTVTAYARSSHADRVANIIYTFADSGGATVGSGPTGPAVAIGAGWARLTATATAPGTAVRAYVRVYATTAGTNWVAGDTLDVTAVMGEVTATAGTYMDGDTPDTTNEDYAWTGAVGASQSTYSWSTGITPGIDPSLTWDTMTCLGPPTNYGRWDDQPSTLRWDQNPPTVTWDTFTGS